MNGTFHFIKIKIHHNYIIWFFRVEKYGMCRVYLQEVPNLLIMCMHSEKVENIIG